MNIKLYVTLCALSHGQFPETVSTPQYNEGLQGKNISASLGH